MNRKVDHYLHLAKKWREEQTLLRELILQCKLDEDYKWMHPCYSLNGANVVLIHAFKDYCALLFFKGVLMKDPKKLLIQQTENVQDRRQMRFTSLEEVVQKKAAILSYIKEAIRVEQSGEKVIFKTAAEFAMPEEFAKRLSKDKALKKAFEALTPGRQKAYLLHFSSAKQAATRESRIEKCAPMILAGKGLLD